MTAELEAVQQALPTLDWLKISTRGGGQITLSPLDAVPEPRNLRQLKAQIRTRWGLVPLLDMLKETVLRVDLLEHFAPAGARGGLDPAELAERLILCIFGYGTNIGLRAIAAGEHRHTEEDLRYIRRRYHSAERARSFAAPKCVKSEATTPVPVPIATDFFHVPVAGTDPLGPDSAAVRVYTVAMCSCARTASLQCALIQSIPLAAKVTCVDTRRGVPGEVRATCTG